MYEFIYIIGIVIVFYILFYNIYRMYRNNEYNNSILDD